MDTRNRLLAGLLAAFLAVAGLACQVEDFEGEPLEDDPLQEEGGGDDLGGGDTADS